MSFSTISISYSPKMWTRSKSLFYIPKPVLKRSANVRCPEDLIRYGIPPYSNEIDFDEASREWNRNKKRDGQMYMYVCGSDTASGKPCQRRPMKDCTTCSQHK
jgi:hypothetical protein